MPHSLAANILDPKFRFSGSQYIGFGPLNKVIHKKHKRDEHHFIQLKLLFCKKYRSKQNSQPYQCCFEKMKSISLASYIVLFIKIWISRSFPFRLCCPNVYVLFLILLTTYTLSVLLIYMLKKILPRQWMHTSSNVIMLYNGSSTVTWTVPLNQIHRTENSSIFIFFPRDYFYITYEICF